MRGLNDIQLGAKLSQPLGKNANSIEVLIHQLKKDFREKDLIKLVEKWRELKEKGKIFGLYNTAKEGWFA